MVAEKISPTLAESMSKTGGDDCLEVIVELEPAKVRDLPGSRAERISQLKESFARQAEPLLQQIRAMGGEVDDVPKQAWINGSLRARVPRKMIPTLAEQSQVVRVDLPHPIKLEGLG